MNDKFLALFIFVVFGAGIAYVLYAIGEAIAKVFGYG